MGKARLVINCSSYAGNWAALEPVKGVLSCEIHNDDLEKDTRYNYYRDIDKQTARRLLHCLRHSPQVVSDEPCTLLEGATGFWCGGTISNWTVLDADVFYLEMQPGVGAFSASVILSESDRLAVVTFLTDWLGISGDQEQPVFGL